MGKELWGNSAKGSDGRALGNHEILGCRVEKAWYLYDAKGFALIMGPTLHMNLDKLIVDVSSHKSCQRDVKMSRNHDN